MRSRRRLGRPGPGHRWRSFRRARAWARRQELDGWAAWSALSRRGGLPLDIPAAPNLVYRAVWLSWGDWLGTGRIGNSARRFWPFRRARAFVRRLRLDTQLAWRAWSKSSARPAEIPTSPDRIYAEEWGGFGDWLGTGRQATFDRTYRAFRAARRWARALELQSAAEWRVFARTPQRPADIPAAPEAVYRAQWKGWGDFLGTGRIAQHLRRYRPFEAARRWAHRQRLESQQAWEAMVALGHLPADIPSNAHRIYGDQWRGWEDFLGIPRSGQRSKTEIGLALSSRRYSLSISRFAM